MEAAKLRKIIDEKNSRKEENVLAEASHIIDKIARHQQLIADATEAIAQLRKDLAELHLHPLDPTTILGN